MLNITLISSGRLVDYLTCKMNILLTYKATRPHWLTDTLNFTLRDVQASTCTGMYVVLYLYNTNYTQLKALDLNLQEESIFMSGFQDGGRISLVHLVYIMGSIV